MNGVLLLLMVMKAMSLATLWAIVFKTKLLCCVYLTSHLTQPLDIAVFGLLKRHMTSELHPLIQTEVSRIQKAEWLSAYVRACKKAFSSSNIISAFSGAGLFLFLPAKVLNRVLQPLAASALPSRLSTPEKPMALENPVLTSSPVDMITYRAANQELKQVALESGGLSTLARRHLDRFDKIS